MIVITKLDKIDNKIISILKVDERSTMTSLMLKTFAREGQRVFRERIKRLAINGVLTIENLSKHGRSYNIELTERFK